LVAGSVSDEGPDHVHKVMTDPRITALPVMLSESEDEEAWSALTSDILMAIEKPVRASIEPAIDNKKINKHTQKTNVNQPIADFHSSSKSGNSRSACHENSIHAWQTMP